MLHISVSLVFGSLHFVLCFIFNFIILTQWIQASYRSFSLEWFSAFENLFMLFQVLLVCLCICVKASKFSNFKHMNMNDVNDISYYMPRKKLIFSHSRLHNKTLKVHAINGLTMALQLKVCKRITLDWEKKQEENCMALLMCLSYSVCCVSKSMSAFSNFNMNSFQAKIKIVRNNAKTFRLLLK